jgi:hypothetical protein
MAGAARATARVHRYLKEDERMSEPLAVGAKAPAFTAEASDGRTYKLADLVKAGHVALIFYPGNNTPG